MRKTIKVMSKRRRVIQLPPAETDLRRKVNTTALLGEHIASLKEMYKEDLQAIVVGMLRESHLEGQVTEVKVIEADGGFAVKLVMKKATRPEWPYS
jgi:hypothetical protein